MMKPFHLSFFVKDKDRALDFYTQVLSCRLGRNNEHWCDVIFFGHQLTFHQANDAHPVRSLDHFGPILDKQQWLEIIEACKKHNIEFVASPFIKNEGSEIESGKFLIKDPDGNILEFKYYADFEAVVNQ